MKTILRIAESAFRQELRHDGHLRLNVMLPITSDTLQVVYSINMDTDDDCDDSLTFQRGSGACGLCWKNLTYVMCDLSIASASYDKFWSMDKYQQKLVRSKLRSLLCIPLFNQKATRKSAGSKKDLQKAFIGVLNIDSDDNLISGFAEVANKPGGCADLVAGMVAETLTSVTG